MDDICLSDSFDNQVLINLTMSKSIHISLKPKLISAIEKTHRLSQSSLQTIKKVQSFPVIMSELLSSTNHTNDSISKDKGKTPSRIDPRIQKAIDLIKETTVQKDNPINVKQLFDKAEKLSGIKHKNFKIIKFIEICEGDHCNLFIERNDWTYFSTFSGNAILALPDGRKIKGTWFDGIPTGSVIIQYPNQSLYYGSVNSELQKDGEGYIYFKNGEKLQTEFRKGRMVGRGKYYDRSGKVREDYRFDNGLMVSSGKA